jgi:peptidoglycan/xylan/chitin deacetylase (PgdA/CDA1 family)
MKAVMYHYVRPSSGDMPYFRYLALDDFRRQLDYFQDSMGFVGQADFLDAFDTGAVPEGVVLTFDDGLADHADYVVPELLARGLWGLFYIPTRPYEEGELLDVHRIHVLVGRHGGAKVLATLQGLLSDDMLSHAHVEEFRKLTYLGLDDDQATSSVKRALNYYVAYECRVQVLTALAEALDGGAETGNGFYIPVERLRLMQQSGMILGNHSRSHKVMSKLSKGEQFDEIERSFQMLEGLVGGLKIRNFCYPYGGHYSFNATTEDILQNLGCRFSFNVEARDIDKDDLLKRPQALPRFDCNMFPFGKARMGDL